MPLRTTSLSHRLRQLSGQVVTARSFRELPPSTVAHALSRLAAGNELLRVRRGHYFVPRISRFGPVPPDAVSVALSALGEARYLPGGVAAANALGFTTQMPMGTADVISSRGRRIRPRALRGVRILERSPERGSLTLDENAYLELLRDLEHLSDLSGRETCTRAVDLVREKIISLERLHDAAPHEPPRVRAMLGAIGECAGVDPALLDRYRDLINPCSRYDFGPLGNLPNARKWGAR